MGRIYTFSAPAQNPGGAKSLASIISGTNHPFRLRKVHITNADVAGATSILITVSRITAIGTGTSLAPAPHITDDTAFTGTAKHTLTVEPTITTRVHSEQWNLIIPCHIEWESGKGPYAEAGGGDGFCVTPGADTGANTIIDVEIEEA